MFDPGPCVYMDKIPVGPTAADVVDIDAPIKANLEAVAKALGEDVDDVTAVILDRDRHADIIRECREAGPASSSSRTATSPPPSRWPRPRAAATSCSASAAHPRA